MDTALINGSLELCIWETGKTIKPTEKGLFGMQMETLILVSFLMTKRMDSEFIWINKEADTKESGSMMFKMDKELKCGQMECNIKEAINKEKRMVTVSLIGQMEQSITEIGKKTW
jgi:hypothetical protein